MSNPFLLPTERSPSHAPLVEGIREEVDAWRASGYPGVSETSGRLLEHWFFDEHQTTDGLPFCYYFAQRETVETVIYLYEVAKARTLADLVTQFARGPVPVEGRPYPRYVVKAATGSGKTKVMSLLIAWSYFHRLREEDSDLSTTSLVVAPNLIVYERLRTDFESGRIFREDPVIPPEWRADFDLTVCLRDDPVPTEAPGVLTLTNIQALYERAPEAPKNPVDALLGPRPPKQANQKRSTLLQLADRGRVLVVNDEAHHLHDAIRRDTGEELTIWQTLYRLDELAADGVAAQFDFSATPRNQQGKLFDDIVVDYPLAQAIEDGIVKRPIIGEISGTAEAVSDDASVRYRRQLGAGVAKWREFRDALEPAGRKPLLFVMAENTVAADQISTYLDTLSDLSGRVLTIHVNMGGKDRGEIAKADLQEARKWAREVDSDNNPYTAIVSVLMLREGWDVRNVCVIVPLRPLTAKAKILPEQTLGRGLRRMTPLGSGMDEKVVIIDHDAFRSLWDEALDEEGLSIERQNPDDVHPDTKVVTVEPHRLQYDIEIPQLTRVLTRKSSQLSTLRPEDVPERFIPLKEVSTDGTIQYTGRDLLSGEVVERAEYPIPVSDQPEPVIAWFVHELARETRVVGQFAVLTPLVRGYIERHTFGRQVDLSDPVVLETLREPAAQEIIISALRQAVDEQTLATTIATSEPKPLILSRTKPFLWSRETAQVEHSIFSLQPCDSGFEVQFCAFLDRCPDVRAFAKLAREVRFSLEYRAEGGRLAYYYPDFVVKLTSNEHLVVETKGLTDLDVPHKDQRASRWALDATAVSGAKWSYVRVDEDLFRRYARDLRSMGQLSNLIFEHHRADYLRSRPAPRQRSREELLALMSKVREKTRGVTGVDDELRRLRDEPRG